MTGSGGHGLLCDKFKSTDEFYRKSSFLRSGAVLGGRKRAREKAIPWETRLIFIFGKTLSSP